MLFRSAWVALFFLFISLCSCHDNIQPDKEADTGLLKGDTAERTLVIYMMAENTLENFVEKDIDEIGIGATSVPSDCRLFVYVDDCDLPRLIECYNKGGVGECRDLRLFTEDFCSSDTAALKMILTDLLSDYPTRELDLVLWSHGDGWLSDNARVAPMRTIGIDNGRNVYSDKTTMAIEIDELAALLEGLPVRVNRLLLDACFMQGVEVAYALRNAVEWVVASPAEIPAEGAPYNAVVGAFFTSDGVEEILESYLSAYLNSGMGIVLSAAYMPAMQKLADATYANVCTYFNYEKKRDYTGVFAYLPGDVQNSFKGAVPHYYDVNSVMKRYLTDTEYSAWRNVLDEAVPYARTTGSWWSDCIKKRCTVDVDVYSGISIYMPQHLSRNASLNIDFANTEWYQAAGWKEAGW